MGEIKTVPALFKDPELQRQFEVEGYAVIDLLEPEDIRQLREMFFHYFPETPPAFNSSSYLNEFDKKEKICWEVASVMAPRLENHLVDYRLFGAAFLSKSPGPKSEMPMHQDWSIVDESKYVAVNIWSPLQDTTEENGTIEVLKGSHRFFHVLRAPTLPFVFNQYREKIKPYLTPIPTRAGQAVVLNQAIIHYSKANMTQEPRLAITTGVCTREAPFEFYYAGKENPEGTLEKFAMPDLFLNAFENFHQSIYQRPTLGESMGFVPYALPQPGESDLMAYLRQFYPEKFTEPVAAGGKQSFWKRLFGGGS